MLLIAAFLGAGAAVAALLIGSATPPATVERVRAPLVVEAARLTLTSVVEPLVGYGVARADRSAVLSAEVAGTIVELAPRLRVGEAFAAGDLLLRIDERDYTQRLARARGALAGVEAQLRQVDVETENVARLIDIAQTESQIAEREYQRVLELFEQGQAPRRELDLARQTLEATRRGLQTQENARALIPERRAALRAERDAREADASMATLDLERCRVTAPFSGRVASVPAELGERVSVGAPLLTLLDPDLIEVSIELGASLRGRVREGAPARLTIEQGEPATWSGAVRRIAPQADERTRTFAVFIEVDNTRAPTPLMPGAFVRAIVDGERLENVLLAPRDAIQQDRVFVCEDGVARRRVVSVERNLLNRSVILGLRAGDVLITSNLDTLYDGMPVEARVNDAAGDDLAGEPADAPARGPVAGT